MVRLIFLVVCCLASALPVGASDAVSKRTRDLFRWFDGLGLEDTSQAKFIRIRTGNSVGMDTGRRDDVVLGWLLEDRGATFRAVLADLTVGEFTKAGKGESDSDFCGYSEISLEQTAEAVRRDLKGAGYFERWNALPWAGYDVLSRPGQIFALARACDRRGLGQLTEDLVQGVALHASRGKESHAGKLGDQLQEDFGQLLAWRIRCSFRSPTASWAEILANCQAMRERCPKARADTKQKMEAELRPELEKLVAAEAEHARRPPVALNDLPPRERARELVWRLRDDVSDRARDSQHWPRPWPWVPRPSNGAEKELLALGMEAVPALLGELRTGHFSRSVFLSSQYSENLWRIDTRTTALKLLEQISGLNILRLSGATTKTGGKDRWALAAETMEEWWTGLQTKGERQWLVDKVSPGGSVAFLLGPRLLAMHPEAGRAALADAVRHTSEPGLRWELMHLLWDQREMVDFFREELKSAPTFFGRVSAAYGLRRHGLPEADEAILAEWQRRAADLKAAQPNGSWATEIPVNLRNAETGSPKEDGLAVATAYLAASGSMDTMRALLEAWPQLPAGVRLSLVTTFAERRFSEGSATVEPAAPAVRVLIQEILLNALDDTTVFFERVARSQSGDCISPRLCDLAADSLRGKWPRKFEFDLGAPEPVREARRLNIFNAHRRESGLAEIPLPPARAKVPPADASHVAAIEWEPDSAKPSPALQSKLDKFKGRKMTARALTEFVIAYANSPVPATKGLRVRVTRDGDGTGVVMRLGLEHGNVSKAATISTTQGIVWRASLRHSIRDRPESKTVATLSYWENFQSYATPVLTSSANQPFTISVALRLE
jgi:hypothetical protein